MLSFKNWEEAQWAFDLFQTAAEALEVISSDDPLFAMTSRYFPNGNKLRFDYGNWLILGVNGNSEGVYSVHVALLTNKIQLDWLDSSKFIQPQRKVPNIVI